MYSLMLVNSYLINSLYMINKNYEEIKNITLFIFHGSIKLQI